MSILCWRIAHDRTDPDGSYLWVEHKNAEEDGRCHHRMVAIDPPRRWPSGGHWDVVIWDRSFAAADDPAHATLMDDPEHVPVGSLREAVAVAEKFLGHWDPATPRETGV